MAVSSTPTSEKVRLTADLSFSDASALKELAASQGVSMTEALKRAISTEKLLHERRNTGSKVLLEKGGTLTELLFTR